MGLAIAPAGAARQVSASESAFCKTLISISKFKQPTGTNYKNYQTWAKDYLPYWEKLASQAPANTKNVLNELVTILKYYASSKNLSGLGAYAAAHEVQWTNGWKAFAKDVETCAMSLY
jgi:hypothetical protein